MSGFFSLAEYQSVKNKIFCADASLIKAMEIIEQLWLVESCSYPDGDRVLDDALIFEAELILL